MRFSVIIPLYNKAPYVEKALRSVFAQTFTDYELVVVDDGSRDESAAIAERLLQNTTNTQLIRQANAGVSTARNNGVKASQGDYLCFLDADDWWAPTFLEEMSQLIAEFPQAGIYGSGYTIVNETKHKTRVASIGVAPDFVKGEINYCKVYAKTLCMPLTSISVAIPRWVFDEMNGFKPQLKLGEDFDLWIRIALKHKVVFLNKPLAYYNQDVPVNLRATNNLHAPEHAEYFFYSQLEIDYPENDELKSLLDKKRVNSMMAYYFSKEYAVFARKELDKVDWSKQPKSAMKLYQKPKWFLKLRLSFLKLGAKLKQIFIRCLAGK